MSWGAASTVFALSTASASATCVWITLDPATRFRYAKAKTERRCTRFSPAGAPLQRADAVSRRIRYTARQTSPPPERGQVKRRFGTPAIGNQRGRNSCGARARDRRATHVDRGGSAWESRGPNPRRLHVSLIGMSRRDEENVSEPRLTL